VQWKQHSGLATTAVGLAQQLNVPHGKFNLHVDEMPTGSAAAMWTLPSSEDQDLENSLLFKCTHLILKAA